VIFSPSLTVVFLQKQTSLEVFSTPTEKKEEKIATLRPAGLYTLKEMGIFFSFADSRVFTEANSNFAYHTISLSLWGENSTDPPSQALSPWFVFQFACKRMRYVNH
jgi:hypothetical protein